MRLWSVHPKYLDPQGLVALWREGLLAKKVLEGGTRGYRNHPQLIRFKDSLNPTLSINSYLQAVCDEADERGYRFDRSKLFEVVEVPSRLSVTQGQIDFEWEHLSKKLFKRSRKKYFSNKSAIKIQLHPLFKTRKGGVEEWEIL